MKDYLTNSKLEFIDMGIIEYMVYKGEKNITVSKLIREHPNAESREAIQNAFNRLVANGYLKREITSTRTVVYNIVE